MMRTIKRVVSLGLSFILALSIVVCMVPSRELQAATFADINRSEMFFKQNTSNTCTLSAAAMMVRRAALLNGNPNWTTVTENNMRSTAWTSGGLRFSFSYAGITVNCSSISSNRTNTMINLLSQHPEGIVIWNTKHAVLLTDYTNGTFYCADPSGYRPGGRIPISQTSVSVESITYYWYVSSPKLYLTPNDTTPPVISDVRVTDINNEGYTVTCRAEDANGVSKVQFPTWTTYKDQDDLMGNWWDNPRCRGTQNGTTWSYRVHVGDHNNEEGHYATHIYAYDAAGNSVCAQLSVIYIDRTQPVISDVQVVDIDNTGYTVTCKVKDASSGISRVQFPTWTSYEGQDDLAANWSDNPSCRGTQNGEFWSFRVNDSEHNYERGIYNTHIYAYDDFGNVEGYGLNNIEFNNTYNQVKSIDYDGHTYGLYNDILTWDDAKAKCEELGGHLVTITSNEEQEAVEKLIEGQVRIGYWIGGRKDDASIWITGEDFVYSNWEPGEPNEDGGEDCYEIYTNKGTWNDLLGSNKTVGFICEWDNEEPDTPSEPDTPVEPDIPEKPDIPSEPDTPSEPDIPEEPDDSSQTNINYKLKDDESTIIITNCTSSDENIIITSMIDGYKVTEIGESAFEDCANLKSVKLQEGITKIGEYAFAGCSGLADITIPESVTKIGGFAFIGTKWLEEKQKENPIVTVNGIVIDGSNCVGDIEISKGVKEIGSYAFFLCDESLTSITVPEDVTKIGEYAFASCGGLTDITIPESVTEIGDYAFLDSGLTTIKGKKGSYAQSYANENGYEFVDVDDNNINNNNNMEDNTTVFMGDLDGDGNVNLNDAKILLKAAVGIMTLNDVQKEAADINSDKQINLNDAKELLRVAVGIVKE